MYFNSLQSAEPTGMHVFGTEARQLVRSLLLDVFFFLLKNAELAASI